MTFWKSKAGEACPGGDLTGIRPVGLCRKMREEKGQSPEILFPALKEDVSFRGREGGAFI